MKRWVLLLFLVTLLFPLVAAESGLKVREVVVKNVVVAELGNFASYNLEIDNLGEEDSFKIFTLVGVQIEPSLPVMLPPGNSTVAITASLSDKLLNERRGLLSYQYLIKGVHRSIFEDKLLVDIVSLGDIIEFEYGNLRPDGGTIEIYVKNKANVQLSNVTVVFDSVFFRESIELELEPYENKTYTILVSKELDNGLVAGPYIVTATVVAGDYKKEMEGVVDFLENEGVSVAESTEGLIIRKTTVRKINRGNTEVVASVNITRDAISRLFTSYSVEPQETVRKGFFVEYVWQKSLRPGENFTVSATTNYTLPFLGLLVIVAFGIFVRYYYTRAVSINKRVSLVKTRGGEFALRVVLRVRARKTVDKLQLIDRLPAMTKLYDGFGKMPDKIESDHRRLVWHIGYLTRGQQRVYSYVIYSKLNVVGQFELPAAAALFEKDGEPSEAFSNRAYYAAEKD
ncbi:MAG: hypothetical protein KKE05_05250 [Nanoarchaeota archaeon]|nr:hypothetical protein [Nanoarchaeota archaeon]